MSLLSPHLVPYLLLTAPMARTTAAAGTATIRFRSSDASEPLVLEQVTEHFEANATGQRANGESFRSICVSPCRIEVPAGFYELRIREGGSAIHRDARRRRSCSSRPVATFGARRCSALRRFGDPSRFSATPTAGPQALSPTLIGSSSRCDAQAESINR